MSTPSGMRYEAIALSPEQRTVHQIPQQRVDGVVLRERGDGWAENSWGNRHLSGSIIQRRKRDGKYLHEFVPVDNVVIESEQVHLQMKDEIERLVGWYDDSGMRNDGELDLLRQSHARLADWLTLTPEDKDDIAKVFSDVADARTKSVNPFSLTAGSIASHARELKDRTGRNNPGAIRAMVLRIERELTARHGELAHNLSVNHTRSGRLEYDWLFHENQVLASSHAIMERLLITQKSDDLDALKLMAPHVRFRVRPFNLLAHEIAQTGYEITDEQVVLNSLAAMQFDRFKNYLLSPFRRVTASPKRRRTNTAVQKHEPLEEALRQRIVALNSMDASGATGRLVNRLIPLGETVLQATLTGNKQTAQKAGETVKWLINYHCLPGDDPETEIWHYHQLR